MNFPPKLKLMLFHTWLSWHNNLRSGRNTIPQVKQCISFHCAPSRAVSLLYHFKKPFETHFSACFPSSYWKRWSEQKLGGSIQDPGVWGVRSFIILLICSVHALFGNDRAALLLDADPMLLGGSAGEERWAADHSGRGAWERRDILWAQLILLL